MKKIKYRVLTNIFACCITYVQSMIKLFAKHDLYAEKAIKYVLNRGFLKITFIS